MLKLSKLKEKLDKCFKEGEKGGVKHKGLRRIDPSKELSINHLKKAEHNFKAIDSFYKSGFSDWSASAAFYTLYHCLLAILAKYGYESRNQSCTFTLVEDFIDKELVKEISKSDLKEISDLDVDKNLESDRIMDIREEMQYTTKTVMDKNSYNQLKEKTGQLFNKLKIEFQRN